MTVDVRTYTGSATKIDEAEITALRTNLRGTICLPGDAGYDSARSVWNAMIDRRPAMIIHDLGLTKPRGWSYRASSNYGHFGRRIFPWEQTNRVDALRSAAGLKGRK